MEPAIVDVNLGLFDGEVSHARINTAVAKGDKSVLFGEQTRLPYFPDDELLPKLHAGDPLVLLFWKVLHKVPENLRTALIEAPLSLTLVRDDTLLHFENYRCHQALHIGCRRRTIYLPEILLHAAEDRGYDYWAIAEGVIYAGWMIMDYLLLVDVLKEYAELARKLPGYRLGEALQPRLVDDHNNHRRDHALEGRSEVAEFIDGYKGKLLRVTPEQGANEDVFALARGIFDSELEQCWAHDKMERIAQVFCYPRLFLFDRDIIHGTARELAEAKGLEIEPRSFADALHDYHDALRFESHPLMTTLGKGAVPKPRAVFLQTVGRLGIIGLRGFFDAYGRDEPGVRDLVHPLWMYLCSLSSDPAGIFSRAGRLRAVGREALDETLDGYLAGVLIRLDGAENYMQLVREVAAMGEVARVELQALISVQRLLEEDEWEAFKGRKQTIGASACQALEDLSSSEDGGASERVNLHEDEKIRSLISDRPHRLTSDPSGVMMYLRTYKNSLNRFGAADPDSDFLLASILVRLDQADEYPELLERVFEIGTPAFTALHNVFEQIPERDMIKREILKLARILWGRLLAKARAKTKGQK